MRLLVTGGADRARTLDPGVTGGCSSDLLYRSAAKSGMTPTRMGKNLKQTNLVDSFFQCFTGFETWLFSSSDLQRLAGLWVTTNASWTISHGESAETNQNNGVASLESASDGFDYSVQRTASSSFRDISGCSDSINQFRLVHSKSPYIYLSMILSFLVKAKTSAEWPTDT